MKHYFVILPVAAATLCGCVNVDEEVAQTPSVYWKAPEDAKPAEFYSPERIKTDKIESEKDGASAKPANVSAKPAADAKAAEKTKANLSASEKMLAGARLNLDELTDIALENNPSTRIYWFQAKRYAAQLGRAQSSYYPQISVGAQVYRDKTKSGYVGIPVGAYYETAYGPSAEINWLLYDFGKREAQVQSAREAMQAANFEFNQTLQDVVLNVNLAYYKYCAAVGNVKAAKLSLEDSKTSYESADRKLKDGVGNKQDMLNALASLRNAEFEVENKLSDVETARAELANALGVSASDIADISDEVAVAKNSVASEKIDSLIAKAMRSRQSLLAGYAKLRQTQSDVKAAKRDFLPQLGANASAMYGWYTDSNRDDQYQYKFGLSASWSIFEGFARKYALIDAKAAERAQAQQLKAEQIQIMSNIWAYYHVYRSSVKQLASAEATVAASEEAYLATRTGFASGVNTLTDLLNAQSRLATARQTKVNATTNMAAAVARLSHAVGALSASEK